MTRLAAPCPTMPATPRRRAPVVLVALGLALVPGGVLAQDIGHTPAESPYRDVPYRQELTLFTGSFAASSDPAGVAPQSGPIVGLRYEIRLGGPAQFFARIAGVSSERTVLAPTEPPATRVIDSKSLALALADIGFSMNLTGQKSWHGFVPTVAAGIGVASTFNSADSGGYKFGTPFAITLGGGVRWVPGGQWGLRADITDHLYQIRYPGSYYQPPAIGVDAVLPGTQSQNIWKHNAALTVGASYLFFR